MATPIEFFFDFSSPYGYFAAHRIAAVGAEFQRDIVWRPILLGAVFKATGQSPLVGQPLRGPYHLHDMMRTARRLKLPFQLPTGFPLATIAAARAYYWVEGQSPGDARRLALALFDAAFGQGINITGGEAVASVARQVGFDADRIRAGIALPEIKERLKVETGQAIDRGIFGSPFFIVDGEAFWGNDRIPDLRDWLKSGGW